MYLTNSYHTDNTENYRNKNKKVSKIFKNSTIHIVRTESHVYNKVYSIVRKIEQIKCIDCIVS